MKRWLPFLILPLFLPALICEAETTAAINPANDNLPPDLLNKQTIGLKQPAEPTTLHYGFSDLTLINDPRQVTKIALPVPQITGDSFFLVKTAEADIQPAEYAPEVFEKICNSVNNARRLDELKPLLTETNFQILQAKVNAGSSPYVVLSMIQAQRPRDIHVLDARVEDSRATLAVTGQSYLGPLQGLIHLVRMERDWRIAHEEWYSMDLNFKDNSVTTVRFIPPDRKSAAPAPRSGLLAELSPDYSIDRKFLPLMKVPFNKNNRAFNFVFLLNREKTSGLSEGPSRPRVHILWPGSKKHSIEQKLIEHEYPVDISIANYEDGFAGGEWNIVLPSKKPRQVIICMLWSF